MSTLYQLIEAEKSDLNSLTTESMSHTVERLSTLRLDLSSGISALAQLMFSTTNADTNLMNDLGCLHLILNDLTDRCTSNEISYREQIAKNNQRGENDSAQHT